MILAAPTNYFLPDETKKSHEPGFWFKMFFLCTLCLFFISCASKPEKHFTYEPTANASDEVRNLQAEMSRAEGEQIGVFAPDSYMHAKKSLSSAKSMQDKGSSNARILNELGDARGYFEQAKDVAARSQKALPEVVSARENSLIAGASLYNRKDLKEADDKLMNVTEKFEKKNPTVSLSDNVDLQGRYQNLELKSIKATRLGDAQSKIEGARKMGAERYAPRSLATAEAKLKSAEMNINTDRHNDALISASAADANHEANKLLKVTELSKKTGRTGNESLAIGVVERDEKISALNQQSADEAARLRASQAQLQAQQAAQARAQANSANQSSQLTEAQQSAAAAQAALEAKKRVDQAYEKAQNTFSKNEAEVFRQGDNLILRMRSVQFPSGRAEVPTASYQTLSKVRDVIQNMNAHQVMVEGHTDATGNADFNQQLSEQRAESVAQYLRQQIDRRSGASTEEVNIEAHGYGYEHPVSSNKTKQGRALNRRVDIVISPELQYE